MTGSTFRERLGELRRITHCREGRLEGSVEVNQVYAHYQHEHPEFHHPRGGNAFYLTRPLMEGYRRYLDDYAKHLLEDGGVDSLMHSMEHMSDQVEISAPREWGDLMKSGHPQVSLGGGVIRNREPKVHRLSEEELRAKSRAILRIRLAAGLTVYFMRHGKVMRIPGRNDPHPLRGRL